MDETRETHSEQSDSHHIAQWLQRHAPEGSTLLWGQNHLVHAGVLTGWVDIDVPAISEALGWNWVWMLVAPDDDDAEAAELLIEHDVTIWRLWDEEDRWYAAEPAVVLAPGQELGKSQKELFQGTPLPVAGWRVETISRGLEKWCLEKTGRVVHFTYDDSVMSTQAVDAGERL